MAPIPSADTPGYHQLRERVQYALDQRREAPDVDFKESAPWNALKWQIIRTALGMGNLRDGGVIVIGVSERGNEWELTGISPEHRDTYDADTISDQIAPYVSPGVEPVIVRVTYTDPRQQHKVEVLTIEVKEFAEIPLVCKKTGPDRTGLTVGAVYVRPHQGRPRTTRVTDAAQMRELLDLAGEKAAWRIIESGRRAGLEFPPPREEVPSVAELLDQELEGL